MSEVAVSYVRGAGWVLTAALLVPAVLSAQSSPDHGVPAGTAPDEPSLEEIRAATERFRDVSVALAEGYVPDPTGMCSTAAMEGRPALLLYEPQADGSMALLGVENLVFRDAWLAAGHDGPPVFHGRTWDAWADDPATPRDEAHGIEPHFDQHVWLFREHPTDVLAPFNPAVTCEHAATDHAGHVGTPPGR